MHRTDEKPIVPNGFEVNLFAPALAGPRIVRSAPNGDVFVAESVGRPLGDDRFLGRIERLTKRRRRAGKRGPKPKRGRQLNALSP